MNITAGTRQTLIPDIQGSIVATLPSTAGLTKTGYQAFGENPSLTTGSFAYTAQRFDAETAGSASQPSGLYYYRARVYSPTWGRFLQPDPIGYAGGSNLYAYVGNSPINGVDPTGLFYDSINPNRDFSSTLGKAQMQVARKYPAVAVGMAGIALGLAVGAEVAVGVGGGAVVGEGELNNSFWSVALKPQNFTSSFRPLGTSQNGISLAGRQLGLELDPTAGTISRVGIVPPESLVGTDLLDAGNFVPNLGSRVSNSIAAALTAAAGLNDLYRSPGENGAPEDLNLNFQAGAPKK